MALTPREELRNVVLEINGPAAEHLMAFLWERGTDEEVAEDLAGYKRMLDERHECEAFQKWYQTPQPPRPEVAAPVASAKRSEDKVWLYILAGFGGLALAVKFAEVTSWGSLLAVLVVGGFIVGASLKN